MQNPSQSEPPPLSYDHLLSVLLGEGEKVTLSKQLVEISLTSPQGNDRGGWLLRNVVTPLLEKACDEVERAGFVRPYTGTTGVEGHHYEGRMIRIGAQCLAFAPIKRDTGRMELEWNIPRSVGAMFLSAKRAENVEVIVAVIAMFVSEEVGPKA